MTISITLITILSALSLGNANAFDRGSLDTPLAPTAKDFTTDSMPPMMNILSDHLTFYLPAILMAASSRSPHYGVLAVVATSSYFLPAVSAQSLTCSAEEECLGDTISVSGNFYATGYRSAAEASITTDDDIYCQGARGCETAVLLNAPDLRCYGSASCSDVPVVTASYGQASAIDALSNSNISVTQWECRAERSCVGATMTMESSGYYSFHGAHSLEGSNVHCAASSCDFRFAAHYSGYGATVYCPSGSRCNLYCYSATGCYGLSTDVEEGATLVVKGPDEYTQFMNVDLDTVPADPWASGMSHIVEAVDSDCSAYASDVLGMVFDDDAADSSIDADQYLGPVCCRGQTVCLSKQITGTSSSQPVLCSGHSACSSSQIHVTSRVLCAGSGACSHATINSSQEVYCGGNSGCESANLIYAPVVYCAGRTSCLNVKKITYSGDFVVFMLGSYAARNAHIECPPGATCTVHCYDHYPNDPNDANPECDGSGILMTYTGNVIVNFDLSVPVILPIDTAAPTQYPTGNPTTAAPTQYPTGNPTAQPTVVPTAPPSSEPTADPTCEAQRHLNWDELIVQGADYESLPEVEYELDVDPSTDTLSVDVYLPYLGSSQRNEDSATDLGTTFFISFRAFSSDDAIANPGNCDNRDAAAFVNKSWAESWRYDEAGASADSLGSAQFLGYGPSDFWSVSADARYADCVERVHYAAEFALPDLLGCADAEGERSIEVVTSDEWMNVSGSLIVSVLSPLTMSFESSSYFQYQLLSAPFSLSISKSVYLLDAAETFVFSATTLAVYRESEGHYVMLLLTESAEFIALNGLSVLDPSMQSSAAVAVDSECIAEQNYICSQVWTVDILDVACPFTLDGDYAFQFTAVCNDDGNGNAAECDQFVEDNGDGVTLSAQLSFADTMCDAEVWTLQYEGAIAFYSDDSFDERADTDAAYRSGADRIFVELRVDIPSSNAANQNFSLYDVELSNVWLCTVPSDVDLTLDAGAVDSTGCFDSRVDGLSPYHIIQNHDATLSSGAAHEETGAVNTARFSFVVPSGVAEGAVYIEMQALLTLKGEDEDEQDGQRRLLTDEKTSSQLQLFMGAVTVSDDGAEEEDVLAEEVLPSEEQEPANGSPSDSAFWMVVVALATFSVAWIE